VERGVAWRKERDGTVLWLAFVCFWCFLVVSDPWSSYRKPFANWLISLSLLLLSSFSFFCVFPSAPFRTLALARPLPLPTLKINRFPLSPSALSDSPPLSPPASDRRLQPRLIYPPLVSFLQTSFDSTSLVMWVTGRVDSKRLPLRVAKGRPRAGRGPRPRVAPAAPAADCRLAHHPLASTSVQTTGLKSSDRDGHRSGMRGMTGPARRRRR